jgi:predicted alpha/beta hydrolase family esterase
MDWPPILIVPGLRDHVADHWQTLLQARLPNAVSVPRMERDKLSCAAWVRMLDQALAPWPVATRSTDTGS